MVVTDHDHILLEASHVEGAVLRATLQSAVSARIRAPVPAHHAPDRALKTLEIPIIAFDFRKFKCGHLKT